MQRPNRSRQIVDHLHRLREDDAIERIVGNVGSVRQVANNRSGRIPLKSMKHVDRDDSRGSITPCIGVFRNFQNSPPYSLSILLEIIFNEDSIDGLSPIRAEPATDGKRAT